MNPKSPKPESKSSHDANLNSALNAFHENNSETPPHVAKPTIGIGKLLLFAVIVLGFVVALIEVGLRLVGFQFVPPSDFALFTHSNAVFGNCIVFDPNTLYRLKPDAKIDFYGHEYQINSLGWRSGEFTPQKPPETRRIVAIGDSNVLGYGLQRDSAFTAILGRLAGEKAAQENLPWKLEAINCGVLGWSSFQVRKALESEVFDYEPDILIVYVGAWNEGLWAAQTDREQWATINKINPRGLLYQSRLAQLMRKPVVERYREAHIKELQEIVKDSNAGRANPEWNRRVSFDEFGADLLWIYDQCESRGIPVIFLSPILRPSMRYAREALNEYRQRLAGLDLRPPSGVIDLRTLTADMPEDDVFLDLDPVHFKSAVHEMIAREIFTRIEPIMNEWSAE